MAARNAASFAFEGLLKPLIFLTYCRDAARTSSGVTGGSKLNSILMFRHMRKTSVTILVLRRVSVAADTRTGMGGTLSSHISYPLQTLPEALCNHL
jgi:hypothetical protein